MARYGTAAGARGRQPGGGAPAAVFRWSRIPAPLRPAIGGIVLAGLAFLAPQVLSAGHGAMHVTFDALHSAVTLLAFPGLKALVSAVSIGSGFRGGLFFASLFLGSVLGNLFAVAIAALGIATGARPQILAIVGMGAPAVSIIGGPLT
jgi:chloride channel protein, CIC family